MEHVFVYGTLRPPREGTPRHDSRFYPQIASYVRDGVPARLPQAVLYDVGAYPAARPGEEFVHGDLLRVEAPALAIMDRIEGHPAFFRRARVRVRTEDGSIEAWVYWAPEDLVGDEGHRIAGGDWFRRD